MKENLKKMNAKLTSLFVFVWPSLLFHLSPFGLHKCW
jgi:hypothetical protein